LDDAVPVVLGDSPLGLHPKSQAFMRVAGGFASRNGGAWRGLAITAFAIQFGMVIGAAPSSLVPT